MSLKTRIVLVEKNKDWLNAMAKEYHYMHREIHKRACPFGWAVSFDGKIIQQDGKPSGFIIFASIHYTRLKDEFGYEGLPTKWQVLSLSRLWLHDELPKNSETCVIAKAMKMIQKRWIEVHPPAFINEPYHVVKIISYADTRYHDGTIYRAANFIEDGKTLSKKRHKNSRGPGMEGAELIRFIYNLEEPKWSYNPIQRELFDENR